MFRFKQITKVEWTQTDAVFTSHILDILDRKKIEPGATSKKARKQWLVAILCKHCRVSIDGKGYTY
jgi:hypothetical protein